MLELVEVHEKSEKLPDLPSDYESKEHVTLSFDDGESISVSRDLLCASSAYFNTMLHSGMLEAQNKQIEIHHVTCKQFETMVKQLKGHENKKEEEMEDIMELVTLSHSSTKNENYLT